LTRVEKGGDDLHEVLSRVRKIFTEGIAFNEEWAFAVDHKVEREK
jgi:hypothetical protein